MLDLVIATDLSRLPKAIEFNFDELKTAYGNRLKQYDGLVVTSEAVNESKEVRAGINRSIAALDKAKKEVKAKCLAPFKEFEEKVNQLIGMGASVETKIGEQINSIIEQRRKEKEVEVLRLVNEHFGCDCVKQFSIVKKDRWFNATYQTEIAVEEAVGEVNRVNTELSLVESKAPEIIRSTAVRMYNERGLVEAIKFINDSVADINAKNVTESAAPVEPIPLRQSINDDAKDDVTCSIKVTGTSKALFALRSYMKANGISYESIN